MNKSERESLVQKAKKRPKWTPLKMFTCLAPDCKERFWPTSSRSKYCGSAKEKTGCAFKMRMAINRAARQMFKWRNPGYENARYYKNRQAALADRAKRTKRYKEGRCRCHLCPVHWNKK